MFLGMECVGSPLSWGYGPLLTKPLPRKMDLSRRDDGSDFEKAIGMVDLLQPDKVFVYAMASEPWMNHITAVKYTDASPAMVESSKLVATCNERGIPAERLFGAKEIHIG